VIKDSVLVDMFDYQAHHRVQTGRQLAVNVQPIRWIDMTFYFDWISNVMTECEKNSQEDKLIDGKHVEPKGTESH
jgi:hypothetical protein